MVCSFVGLGIGAYAGLKAQQIAHCTNANIDARGQVQIQEAAATRVFARAIDLWVQTLHTALTVKPGSAEQKKMVHLFRSQTEILLAAVGDWNDDPRPRPGVPGLASGGALLMSFAYVFPRVRVLDWHDGDTFHPLIDLGFGLTVGGLDFNGRQTLSCRLAGMNAPELSTDAGKAALTYAQQLCPPGSIVTVGFARLGQVRRPVRRCADVAERGRLCDRDDRSRSRRR
jgi:hypothetical protein